MKETPSRGDRIWRRPLYGKIKYAEIHLADGEVVLPEDRVGKIIGKSGDVGRRVVDSMFRKGYLVLVPEKCLKDRFRINVYRVISKTDSKSLISKPSLSVSDGVIRNKEEENTLATTDSIEPLQGSYTIDDAKDRDDFERKYFKYFGYWPERIPKSPDECAHSQTPGSTPDSNPIASASPSSPEEVDPRLREYKEQDLHKYHVFLAKMQIAKHFQCEYHELDEVAEKNPEEFAKIKTYYINFMGRNFNAFQYTESLVDFLNGFKRDNCPENDDEGIYEDHKYCVSDEIIETVREQRLNDKDLEFMDRVENYIVKNMINPYDINIGFVFQEDTLKGIIATDGPATNREEYRMREWVPKGKEE